MFPPIAFALLCGVAGEPTAPPAPLVTVAAVRELTNEQADKGRAVDLTGVVTQVTPNRLELFIQDRTCGVCVRTALRLEAAVRRGARVRVIGRSEGGWFSPIVIASSVAVLGDGSLPDPLPFDLSATGSRWLDAQYVQCHCLVRATEAGDRAHLLVEGSGGPGRLEFLSPVGAEELRKWVGTVVRARGVCIPEFDASERATGAAIIGVAEPSDLEVVLTAESAAALPVRSAAHLRAFLPGTSPIPLVRAGGVVVAHVAPDALAVQDDTGGYVVRLRAGRADTFPKGTRVQVAGFLFWNKARISVNSGEVTATGTAPLPDPREFRPGELSSADGIRVRLRGQVTEVRTGALTLVSEGTTITVRAPPGAPLSVERGSTVTVTGTLLNRATGPVVLLNAPDELTVESVPERPWFTHTQLEIAGAAVGFAGLLGIAWVVALRSAVRTRTRQLAESEQKFATAFHSSPDAVILTRAADGTFLEVNAGFGRLTGYTREQALGRSTLELNWLAPGEPARLLETIRREGSVRDHPATVRDASGHTHEVSISSTAVTVGGESCLLGIIRDVTDQKAAERAAREEKRFTETMIESMPGVLYFYGAEGRFLRWNRNFEAVTGYSAAEIARMHPLDFFRAEEKELLTRRIGAVFETGASFVEAPFVTKSGAAIPYLFTGRRVVFGGGPCLVGIGIDISERYETERRLLESERKYRELVELANSIILRWTPDGRVTFLNEFGQRAFGYTAAEIVGRHVMDTIVPATETSGRDLRDLMLRVCADPKSFEQNLNENVRRTGERVWIAWTNRIVFDADGNVIEILSVGTDVTERRRMEQAVAASEKKFAAVFRLSPVALTVSKLDGTIQEVNQAFERLYRLRRDDVVGKAASEFRQLYDSPEERGYYAARMLREGRLRDIEKRRALDDGSLIDTITAAELIELDGSRHVLAVTTDITPLKRAEAELREANATLERRVAERTDELTASNQELEAFCYSVSHDLRAPLRAIDGFTQAVLEDYDHALDAEGKQYLARVRAAAGRMSELIDDLLTLSRVTRAGMHRQPVDLSALAAEALADLRQANPEREIEVAVAPGLAAHGDRALLRVALDNLLGNAWKYTGRTPHPRIEFLAEDGPAGRVFVVRDNGAGFDPAYAHKLFQPFQRLHRPAEFPGHGVGLATVLRIVRRHGGAVTAEGSVCGGATFRFTIPPPNEGR